MSWAPSDFDDDARPSPTQRGDVLPRVEGVPLPRPGSSDAISLMAACASENMVTRSGVAFLCAATSSAWARAAHSAS